MSDTQTAVGNLFDAVPPRLELEHFSELASGNGWRIERIVSTGQSTPPGEWLEQPETEWVTVIQGQAQIWLESEDAAREMGAGDWVLIPGRNSSPCRVDVA